MKTTISIGLITYLSISTPVLAGTYKVTKVHDGDTVTVVNTSNNRSIKVRLACIDAPEGSQPQGKLSTITLNAFIPVGSSVELNEVDVDNRYGRSVSEVLKNGINVNVSMLKKGQAIVYHKYLSNCPNSDVYIQAENAAKSKKIGFWNDSSFITPEDWRRGKREISRPRPNRTVSQPSSSARGYVAGTCKYLRSLGMSRFRPGDANYTRKRDRDGDGVACE